MLKCPHCGRSIVSEDALRDLAYIRKYAKARGGFMWEGAREAYERGEYVDTAIAELLAAGLIKPHQDPAKGWVPA